MASTANKSPSKILDALARVGKLSVRVSITLGVAAASLFAVNFGAEELSRRADAAPSPEPAAIIPVETAPIVLAPGYAVTRSFIGQIEAKRTTAVSFELAGRLDSILVDEGDRVAAGQVIATLDTRLLKSERDRLDASKEALTAQLSFATKTLERQTQLNAQGFASQAAFDEASSRQDELRARIAEAEAALMSNTIQLEKSEVLAPFDGRITTRLVDGGESVAPGQTLIEIVEAGAPHLRVGVPLDITASDLNTASVDIEGVRYDARLITLRPDIDPVTRTRTAILEVLDGTELAFGQTARLRLTDEVETRGFWVPVTTLKEGQRGQWTLLAVDGAQTVQALSVQVVHTEGDRVFVRGAFPEGAALITKGPQRVTVGQAVAPRPAL